jgi:hypothetical protein
MSKMNKPMVLVIHGMGTHKPGETKQLVIDGLNNAAKQFNMQNFKIEEKVDFFQFNYSDFLDEIRLKDAEHASYITEHIGLLQGNGLGEKLATELTNAFAGLGEDKMFNTHWLDVIYYGLNYWGEKIRVDLAKQLNDLMIERTLRNRPLHIIAHSLGSAVLHDTLAKIYRRDIDIYSKVPQLDSNRFKIESTWMVANVSRLLNLLNDIADPNHSIVNSDAAGCTEYLYNVRNEFDPFTWIKKYDRPIEHGKHIDIGTVRKINTHDLQEYMEAPDTAWYFFARVLGINVSASDYDAGVAKHKATSINTQYDAIKVALNDVKQISGTDFSSKAKAIKALVEAVEATKSTLDALQD